METKDNLSSDMIFFNYHSISVSFVFSNVNRTVSKSCFSILFADDTNVSKGIIYRN